VIIQETGFTRIFGGGRHGLIAFKSLGEIAEAVKSINADYTRHSLAAREIARQFFEADKVLRSLLERAGI
jgi:Trk K+ transport system NAD-binding subunit